MKKKNVFPSLLLLPVNMVSVLRLRQNRLKSSRLPLLSIRQQPTNNKSQILAFSGSCSLSAFIPVPSHPHSFRGPILAAGREAGSGKKGIWRGKTLEYLMQSVKKNKVRGITLPDVQNYCMVTVIMTLWTVWRDRHMEQWDKIGTQKQTCK